MAARKRANLLTKELAWLRRGAPARTSKPKFHIAAAEALIADAPPPRDSVELVEMASARLGKDVIDLQLGVASLTDADPELAGSLSAEAVVSGGQGMRRLALNGEATDLILGIAELDRTLAGRTNFNLIAQEADGDRTATGQEWAALCRAARPTAEAKTTAWESVAAAGASVSNSVVMQTGLGLTRTRDEALLRPFAERYLAEISGVWGSRTHAIAEAVVEYFYPMALADARLLDDTQSWLDTHPDAPAGLRGDFQLELAAADAQQRPGG